jgi:Inner membrane component of T3SS, cytoplasmic domain
MKDTTTTRRWPAGTDYSRVVQSPETAFVDSELAGRRPQLNTLGMPMVASGQNAVVFLVNGPSGNEAVRCFLTPPTDGQRRYEALEAHLEHTSPRALTSARWVASGIVVDGETWPVVVMPWIEGDRLNDAVEQLIDNPDVIRDLANQWAEVVRSLQYFSVAHGDLQHGNVLVRPSGQLALVDLDGVWVPDAEIDVPIEVGHPNYQHPGRTVAHWGRFVDSFPGMLIELGLRALAADPALQTYLNGENLLFTSSDLAAPQASRVWDAVSASPDVEVRDLAGRLRFLCSQPAAAAMLRYDDLRVIDTTAPNSKWAAPIPVHPLATPDVAGSGPQGGYEGPRVSAGPGDGQPTPAGSQVAPAPSATGRSSIRTMLAKGPVSSGAVAGAVAGLIACFISKRLTGVTHGGTALSVVFLGLVGLMLGGFLTAWQNFISGSYRAATRRFAIGAALGAISAAASLYPANLVKRAMHDFTNGQYRVSNIAMGVMWALVASLLSACLGALRSRMTSFLGFLTGAVSGFLGGLVFGATAAKFDDHGRLVNLLRPTTFLTVACVCAVIGAVFGRVTAIRRLATLRIMEGRNQGMEVVVERAQATIGSDSKSDLVLAGDDGVAGTHLTIDLAANPPTISAHGPTRLNGQPVTGPTPLPPDGVVMIGRSFIRISTKDHARV